MTDDIVQYKFNIPSALHARLKSAAKQSLRSLNNEIVARLEATFPAEQTHTSRPIVDDEMEILKRLADGDTICFSQDGDAAWFTKGDGAFVGNAIISLRSKGYLKRECDDEENYRGMSEYDTISDFGRAAVKEDAP